MEVVYWDTVTPPPACCVANVLSVGNFDGVHQGHRALLRRLSRLKQRLGARSMVITFDPPPQALLRPQTSLPPLTTIAQRLRIIERLNVDVAMVLVTTPRLLSLTSSEFLNDLLAARLQLRGMVEGRNFGFGKDRTGDIATLEAWCAGRDISLEIEIGRAHV